MLYNFAAEFNKQKLASTNRRNSDKTYVYHDDIDPSNHQHDNYYACWSYKLAIFTFLNRQKQTKVHLKWFECILSFSISKKDKTFNFRSFTFSVMNTNIKKLYLSVLVWRSVENCLNVTCFFFHWVTSLDMNSVRCTRNLKKKVPH